jgi:NitT/TauT family transport system ATP-binding protein
VAGLLPPTSGEIRIDGVPVTGVPKDIGFVFQQYTRTLLPWRTVYRNAELGLELRGVPEAARREPVVRALWMMGLEDFAQQRPYELSGGMQQRLALARTFAYNPRILLMDEPFGALDAQTRELLQDDLLRVVGAERKTTLFITHDIREALYLGDRIVVMSARPGRILEIVEPGFPQPRRPELKLTPEFSKLAAEMWDLLRPETTLRMREEKR